MIWQCFLDSLIYIVSDQFFWLSMAMTMIMGIFIGATIFDGLLKKFKKGLITLVTYGLLIITTTFSRVIPLIDQNTFTKHHPFSGVATVLTVSIAYFLGMFLGVKITNLVVKKHDI